MFYKKKNKDKIKKIPYIKNIIIGGGLSGLNTLYNYYLKTKKTDICLFEKDSHFGGRIKTFKKNINHKNYLWEEGASRFNENHKQFIHLLKKLDLNKKIIKIGASIKFYPRSDKNKIKYKDFHEPFYYILKIQKYFQKDKNIKKNKKYLNYTILQYAKKYNILNKDELNYLKDSLGYNSKLTHSNVKYVLYLIFKHYHPKNQYYTITGGYQQIINKLYKNIKKSKLPIYNHFELKNIKYNSSSKIFTLYLFNNKSHKIHLFQSSNLILALPKFSLSSIPYLKKIKKEIDTIDCIPMNRLYCIYPKGKKDNKVWFDELGKSTTDSWLRYVIPIDKKKGIIMISYTNDKYAKKVKKIVESNNFEDKIKEEVKRVFNIDIKKPLFCKMSYWDCGVSIWKKGVDYKKLYKDMLQPIKNEKLYIIGENYSLDQAWMEGALDTSKKILNKIIK